MNSERGGYFLIDKEEIHLSLSCAHSQRIWSGGEHGQVMTIVCLSITISSITF